MEQAVSTGDERRRRLGARTIGILFATTAAVVQTAWIGALAWGLYETAGWLF